MATDDPLIGTTLAERYRVDALIGEGAMGRVYRAEHVLMRKRVAVKVLHRELTQVPEIVQRFEREARAAAHIDHPHVASATDFGKLPDGSIYLVLEFVEGKGLNELIERGPVAPRRVLGIAVQIAAALQAAHEAEIVHRDLKPDNVLLVSKEDESDFVKVLDFGIAKVPAEPTADGKPITQVGMVYGTPEYMAPEQALGQPVDGRADLYSLGVLMYEMLCGSRPYAGPSVGLLGQQLSKPLPTMSQRGSAKVPAAIEEYVRRLLAPDATNRVPRAEQVVTDLEALLTRMDAGELRGRMLSASFDDVTGRFTQATQPIQKAVSSPRGKGAFLALLFGGVGVVIAIAVIGTMAAEPPPPEQKPARLIPPEAVEETATGVSEQDIENARQAGVEALQELAQEHPAEGQVHATLALALAKAKQYEDAVDAARVALALDPQLNESPKIAGALFRAAQSTTASSSAFRLLEGAMGTAGADIIYDLRHTEGVKSWVRTQSTKFLRSAEVREVASPALLLLLDLRTTQDCEKMAELVRKAAVVGDKRALPVLRELQEGEFCAAKAASDCFPCLQDSNDLEATIRAIERRATLDDASEPGAASDPTRGDASDGAQPSSDPG